MKNFGLPLERYNDKLDVMVRPYLTYNDIIEIAEDMIKHIINTVLEKYDVASVVAYEGK